MKKMLSIKTMNLNIVKATYDKSTINIIFDYNNL